MALSLRGPVIRGGVPSGAENAAQLVNLTNSFGSARASSPQFDEISNANIQARADELSTKFQVEGATHETGLSQLGQISRMQQITDAYDELNNRSAAEGKVAGTLGSLGKIAGSLFMGGPTAPIGVAMGGVELATNLFG